VTSNRMARWLSVGLFALPTDASSQVTFPVTFAPSAGGLTVNERAQLTSHFQAAGQRWVGLLGISAARSIEIQIEVDNTIATFGGASFTSAFVGVEQGRNTFEQGAAAELRTGTDPNAATPDVRIIVSEPYLRGELWFDPDPVARTAPVPESLTDAMSVALHELGHALGYNGFASGAGVPPMTFWSTFDRWMQPGSPTLFNGPVVLQVWGSPPDLTSNNIFHWSNQAIPAPVAPRLSQQMFEPIRWEDGVPLPQIRCHGPISADAPKPLRPNLSPPSSKGTPPPGLLSELMNGIVFYRGHRYDISELDLAVMADVGLPPSGNAAVIFRNGFEAQ